MRGRHTLTLLRALTFLMVMWVLGAHAQDATVPKGFELKIGDEITGPPPTPLVMPKTEWLFQSALFLDYLQSMNIHNNAGLIEANPILGAHPNEARITGYFVGASIVHWLFTRELVRSHMPNSVIQTYESGTAALEFSVVKHNVSMGVKFYVP